MLQRPLECIGSRAFDVKKLHYSDRKKISKGKKKRKERKEKKGRVRDAREGTESDANGPRSASRLIPAVESHT